MALDEPGLGAVPPSLRAVLGSCGQAQNRATSASKRLRLARTRPALDRLAEKIDAKATWEQIVLPQPESALLHRIAERRRMWERVFPADTPLGVIDHERLARLNLTGGNIQSMALTAAFMAAQAKETLAEQKKVTMPPLLEAGRMEFRKLERPVNEADFRWVETAGGRG